MTAEKKMHSASLRSKMLIILGVVFLIFFVFGWQIFLSGIPMTSYKGLYAIQEEAVLESLSELADVKKKQLFSWVSERKDDVLMVSHFILEHLKLRLSHPNNNANKKMSETVELNRLINFCQDFIHTHNAYDALQVIDGRTKKILVSSHTEEIGMSLSVEQLSLPDTIYEPYLTVIKGKDERELFLTVAMQINTSEAKGSIPLILILYSNLNNGIIPLLHTGIGMGATGEVVLVDDKSRILAPLKYPLSNGKPAIPLEFVNKAMPAVLAATGIEGIMSALDYRGVEVLSATRSINISSDTNWGLVVKKDRDEAFAPVQGIVNYYLFFLGFSFVLLSIALYVSYIIISKPIGQLAQSAIKIRSGELSERSSASGFREVDLLSESFNSMAQEIENWHTELEDKVAHRTVELNAAVDELRRQEAYLTKLIDTMNDGFVIVNESGLINFVNRRLCEMTCYSDVELKAMVFYDLLDNEEIPKWRTQMEKRRMGVASRYEITLKQKNGSNLFCLVSGSPLTDQTGEFIGSFGVITDFTEQKKLYTQLLQSQKLESIGMLAGGIAHDFNNMLQAIIGYSSLLKKRLNNDQKLIEFVNEIQKTSYRAAELTRGLLAYSRKQAIILKPECLNEIIRDTLKMLKRTIGEDIELSTELCDPEPIVMADGNQLRQVLINLATNARDAMPSGGALVISTSLRIIDDMFINMHGYGDPGRYALLTVSDTGNGMDEETRNMIFEPFYTTKEVGKGTGLGLSVVYGIIKQHNGYINCYSELGKGTTFKMYIPLAESANSESTLEEVIETPRGTETILLAEDNESVRRVTAIALRDAGYTLIEAVDGEDAVEKFRQNKDAVKMVIMDIIMPRKNGRDAYEEMRMLSPDIKVCFISGYTADLIKNRAMLDEVMQLISKPINPEELLNKVRELLDS